MIMTKALRLSCFIIFIIVDISSSSMLKRLNGYDFFRGRCSISQPLWQKQKIMMVSDLAECKAYCDGLLDCESFSLAIEDFSAICFFTSMRCVRKIIDRNFRDYVVYTKIRLFSGTYSGNANGAPCHFPFVYDGETHDKCIPSGSDADSYWCSTTSNFDDYNKWGHCTVRDLQGYRLRRGFCSGNDIEVLTNATSLKDCYDRCNSLANCKGLSVGTGGHPYNCSMKSSTCSDPVHIPEGRVTYDKIFTPNAADPCIKCQNGAECFPNSITDGKVICLCQKGYTGSFCEFSITLKGLINEGGDTYRGIEDIPLFVMENLLNIAYAALGSSLQNGSLFAGLFRILNPGTVEEKITFESFRDLVRSNIALNLTAFLGDNIDKSMNGHLGRLIALADPTLSDRDRKITLKNIFTIIEGRGSISSIDNLGHDVNVVAAIMPFCVIYVSVVRQRGLIDEDWQNGEWQMELEKFATRMDVLVKEVYDKTVKDRLGPISLVKVAPPIVEQRSEPYLLLFKLKDVYEYNWEILLVEGEGGQIIAREMQVNALLQDMLMKPFNNLLTAMKKIGLNVPSPTLNYYKAFYDVKGTNKRCSTPCRPWLTSQLNCAVRTEKLFNEGYKYYIIYESCSL